MEEQEKQYLQSLIEVQEATLTALGKELHDNIGQLLGSSKVMLGIAMRNQQNTPASLKTAFETLSHAMSELRAISRSLDKEWLQKFSLIDNLNTQISRINAANELEIRFSHPEKLLLKSDQQILLYRILQEALQNAIKHAEPNQIVIRIEEQPVGLNITVADDGKGFDTENSSLNGSGLTNIRHRTSALGGTVSWKSTTSGTILSIHLPVQNVPL